MAPKSKQVARRAHAQGKGKGKGRSESAPLDEDYESGLHRQLPEEAQRDVAVVAQVLMNTYDDMPVDIAMASASRVRREQRALFDNILRNARRVRQRTTAPADMRPLITPRWRDENPQEWDRLWNLSIRDVCPVCHERPDVRDGPMNSDVPTRCTHWACVGCWEQIAQRDMRCPICRDDLSHWLQRHS